MYHFMIDTTNIRSDLLDVYMDTLARNGIPLYQVKLISDDAMSAVLTSLENIHVPLQDSVKYIHQPYPDLLQEAHDYIFQSDYSTYNEELEWIYDIELRSNEDKMLLTRAMVTVANILTNRIIKELELNRTTYHYPIDEITLVNPVFRNPDLVAVYYSVSDKPGFSIHQHLRLHNE